MHPADDIGFRPATETDWPGIWEVFRETIRGGDTYTYSPDIDEQTARAIWMPDTAARRVTYVAIQGGQIVGTAFLRPNGPGLGDHIANAGWMVSTTTRGRGIGRRFAQHVIDDARRLGYHAMQFNAVVATNERAVALWLSLGFEIIGTVPEAYRHATLGLTPLYIMYRKL